MKCNVCLKSHAHKSPFSNEDIKFLDNHPAYVTKLSCGSDYENAFVVLRGIRIETNPFPQYKGFMCGMSKARHKTVKDAWLSFEERQY